VEQANDGIAAKSSATDGSLRIGDVVRLEGDVARI
jgi:hypothetical protein